MSTYLLLGGGCQAPAEVVLGLPRAKLQSKLKFLSAVGEDLSDTRSARWCCRQLRARSNALCTQ